jgi:hypothetical protein
MGKHGSFPLHTTVWNHHRAGAYANASIYVLCAITRETDALLLSALPWMMAEASIDRSRHRLHTHAGDDPSI